MDSSKEQPTSSGGTKLRDDVISVIERNGTFVKSIKVAVTDSNSKRKPKTNAQHVCTPSGGTLTTIPEGRIDFVIPRPIWPRFDRASNIFRSDKNNALADEAVLVQNASNDAFCNEGSIKDILTKLLNDINTKREGEDEVTLEDMLQYVNEKICLSLEALRRSTEDEMRKLSVNLSNSRNVSSVVRAFSNSSGNSTSGNSSQSSPEWSGSCRIRISSSEAEDIYHIPSGSSSSGFSDSVKHFDASRLPVFVHENLSSVPNGIRNAMIYGTLARGNLRSGAAEKVAERDKSAVKSKKSLLQAAEGSKPSVWEQYYGVDPIAEREVPISYVPKPTDVPVFVSKLL